MPLKDALAAELKHEASNTRKMLERLPEDKFDWKPHEKSYSIIKLAHHIAILPAFVPLVVLHDELDFANPPFNAPLSRSRQELLEFFDKRVAEAVDVLNSATDEMLNNKWKMRRGEHVLFNLPKKVAIRNLVLNHIVHHRGQLSVFLRMLDVPVPGMYGPSADER
jgi:uncharacterized damage-inducible protein DinB